jgi:hypothetical protein
VEGNIYLISNLSVKSNNGSFLASLHDQVLEFNFRTVLELLWAYGMPHPGDSFSASNHFLRMDQSLNYMLSKLERPVFVPDFFLFIVEFQKEIIPRNIFLYSQFIFRCFWSCYLY